ncbi:MAG TPA: ferredoxin [Nautiliaceae bacterium]|nr:ferredoxin [Nautiliaceae bacterium]
MKKVLIDREICIACGACGAIADKMFIVPTGHKSLFIDSFLVYDKKSEELLYKVDINKEGKKILVLKDKDLVKEINYNSFEEAMEELSEFLGEETILVKDIKNEEESEEAEMGENACPVAAIKTEK